MYCSVEDVERYLSPHRSYTGQVYDKVEMFIKEISIDIDSLLTTLGIRLPIPNTESKFLDFLKYWATIGASGKTELSLHGPNEDPRVMSYGQMLWRMYEQWKANMLNHVYDINNMIEDQSLLTSRAKIIYDNIIYDTRVEDDIETIYKRDEEQW